MMVLGCEEYWYPPVVTSTIDRSPPDTTLLRPVGIADVTAFPIPMVVRLMNDGLP